MDTIAKNKLTQQKYGRLKKLNQTKDNNKEIYNLKNNEYSKVSGC